MPSNSKIFAKYLNGVFIETGCYLGDGISQALSAGYLRIISIELSDKYFRICSERFRENSSVDIIRGDSSEILGDILDGIDDRITFWLDGHYSGGDTALGLYASPLMKELECISKHRRNDHTILIDDMRCWSFSEYGFTKEDILKKLLQINPSYQLNYEDGFVAKDILVAHL